MATVIPVDEFISDEWYPGFKPGYTHAPWYVDPVQTFRKEDEENGVPASKGIGRGIARVLHNADELHRLSPGEVLVCESTSPNWTPAFAKIAACVCDGGGTLSHAAIAGREYGVPTVTAVGLATLLISDGDEVEVDGSRGHVTVLKHAGGVGQAAG